MSAGHYVVIGFNTEESARMCLDSTPFLGTVIDAEQHPDFYDTYLEAAYPEPTTPEVDA